MHPRSSFVVTAEITDDDDDDGGGGGGGDIVVHIAPESRFPDSEKDRARRTLQSFLGAVCQNAGRPPTRTFGGGGGGGNAVSVAVTAERWEMPAAARKNPASADFGRETRLSGDERAGPRSPLLVPSADLQLTDAWPSPLHDDNNNSISPTGSDDIVIARRHGNDHPFPWQREPLPWQQPEHVRYNVAFTLRSVTNAPTDDDTRRRILAGQQYDPKIRAISTSGTSSLDRACARPETVFRRSLSLPVVDRSEAFMASSTATGLERDRVRLPQTVHHWPMSPPPTRLKSPVSSLSTVSEF